MLSNDCFQPKINNLRVVLNCFYVYLICNVFQYAKQVIFQYPYSTSKLSPRIYMSIRSIVSVFCILICSNLILYALWFEHVGLLSISTILLLVLLIIRFVFDIYGYSVGYFEYSLYPPFDLITTNITKIKKNKEKQIKEEMTDFSMELIMNMIGILLTMFIIIRMIIKKYKRRQMELAALRIDVIRRMTV
ncbi:unnamed protein product [Rotaria sp. Silwood2]|nr:unnamed protein product [Rotaria sp. Silwood2]CAF2911381.1 unnamed protein product [Rotaria sp. Silwood2]CAF4191887.1 unnamed protein product [Rotaria sp. Silwood2]